jgi:hypothetical protein
MPLRLDLKIILFWLAFVVGSACLQAMPTTDLIMNSVVRISGSGSSTEPVMGTGFLVQGSSRNQAWLVSAAHVFQMISGNKIDLLIRQKKGKGFSEKKLTFFLRAAGENLFIKHERYDLAALSLELPDNCVFSLLGVEMFADEKRFVEINAKTGSRLLVYGYPYGEAYDKTGFCIVRGGIISSFPLLPSSEYTSYLVDFEVFEGYSGSPVLFVENGYNLIVGMALEEVFLEELRPGRKRTVRRRHGLGLARVLNSALVKSFVEALP